MNRFLKQFTLLDLRRRSIHFISVRDPISSSISSSKETTTPSFLSTYREEKYKHGGFDFKSYMFQKTKSINQALDSSVPVRQPTKLHEAMRYTLIPGEPRFYSLMCIACCELVGGQESIAMPTACATEILFAMGNVLDDLPCMDNNDGRLGKPPNHKIYGEDVAILASFSLQALAFEHIATATKGVSPERIFRVIGEMGRAIGTGGFTAGQVTDLRSAGKCDVGLEELEFIHLHKAARVVEAFAVSGAILGGASQEEINKLRKFSNTAGLLGMVVDEVLDIEEDVKNGKLTYPRLIGFEKSMEFAQKLNQEAKDQLSGFDPEKAAPLVALVDFLLDRAK